MGRLRRSLLTRVALTFASSVAITALALSLAAYFLTRHAQEVDALEEALAQSRQNLTVADAMLPADPTPGDYEALMPAFAMRGDFDTLLLTGDETYRSGLDVTEAPITAELAEAVVAGNIRYQELVVGGELTIVVGSRLRSNALTVYFLFPQGDRLQDLAQLRNILIIGGVLLAVLGAVGGYLLARRLLRPVRQASLAAVRMSRGDLDIRLPGGTDEFGVLAQSFNRMASALQAEMNDLEAGQARERRFVADVTHELRTPLAALVGEASLLKTRLDADPSACPPEIARLAHLQTQDISRLRELVDDLLEICRLDARSAESHLEPVEVGLFLQRMIAAHEWSDEVSVLPGRDSPTPLTVLADRRLLERIMVNLVVNALTHGAAPVSVEARVAAGENDDPRMISVAVTDSGPGISLQHLPHVFDRFYKADPSRGTSRGSGLGLAIARENARLMGGDLTVANAPSRGARFVLTLPSPES